MAGRMLVMVWLVQDEAAHERGRAGRSYVQPDAGALRLADAPPIKMGLRALRGHAKAALTGRLTGLDLGAASVARVRGAV